MKKQFWIPIAIGLFFFLKYSHASSSTFECYDFIPKESDNVNKVSIRFKNGTEANRFVNFRVSLKNNSIDEGISNCTLTSGSTFRCIRDDSGGDLTISLGSQPNMKVIFWYLGEEGVANPPSLPANLNGQSVKCPSQ